MDERMEGRMGEWMDGWVEWIGFVENASIRIQSNENNLCITELEN